MIYMAPAGSFPDASTVLIAIQPTTIHPIHHAGNSWVFKFPSKLQPTSEEHEYTMVSVGPNNSYVLQPTTTSIHQRYMYSSTLLVRVKNYYTYNGTSWLTSWLS